MWRRRARIAAGAILLAGVLFGVPRCAHFVRIDSCLDNGGVWDDAHDRCTR